MRKFKIHPDTLSVACPKGVLTDKSATYNEDIWEPGDADQLVKEGFLVEVKSKEEKK